jgi:6-phospho-3-hexuloisomerase
MDFSNVRNIVLQEVTRAIEGVDSGEVEQFCRMVAGARRLFLTGEGRSGLMAKAFAMRLMHIGYTVYVVGETTTPAIGAGDLLISVSGSGETAATLHVVTGAKKAGAQTALVSSQRESPIGQAVDFVLVFPGATKKRKEGELASQQPLGSLFDQAAHLALDGVIFCLVQGQESGALARHSNLE